MVAEFVFSEPVSEDDVEFYPIGYEVLEEEWNLLEWLDAPRPFDDTLTILRTKVEAVVTELRGFL